MRVGEVTEILITLYDKYNHGDPKKEALEKACNILESLPYNKEVGECIECIKASMG